MSSARSTFDPKDPKDYSNVSHNYDNERDRRNNNHGRPPLFTGDAEKFPWWKRKLYSHIIGIDDELWDVIEDGIDIEVDDEGKSANRKSLTEEANLALMATTSSDAESKSESDSDSEDEDEVYSDIPKSKLISMIKDSIRLYMKKLKELKIARKSYLVMFDEVDKLRTVNKSQQMILKFTKQKYLALKQSVSDGIP